jgi:hypothetical protein
MPSATEFFLTGDVTKCIECRYGDLGKVRVVRGNFFDGGERVLVQLVKPWGLPERWSKVGVRDELGGCDRVSGSLCVGIGSVSEVIVDGKDGAVEDFGGVVFVSRRS